MGQPSQNLEENWGCHQIRAFPRGGYNYERHERLRLGYSLLSVVCHACNQRQFLEIVAFHPQFSFQAGRRNKKLPIGAQIALFALNIFFIFSEVSGADYSADLGSRSE